MQLFLYELSDLQQQQRLASFGCIRHKHSWPCYCNLPHNKCFVLGRGAPPGSASTANTRNSALTPRCPNGPNAAAGRRGRRRKWRSPSTRTLKANPGPQSQLTAVTLGQLLLLETRFYVRSLTFFYAKCFNSFHIFIWTPI